MDLSRQLLTAEKRVTNNILEITKVDREIKYVGKLFWSKHWKKISIKIKKCYLNFSNSVSILKIALKNSVPMAQIFSKFVH